MHHTRSNRALRVAIAAAVLLVSAVSQVECSDPDEFNIECYRDLCNARQFCSDTEERCKPCLPAHCLHKQYTPKECEPLCPELLKTTAATTTSSSTTTTTAGNAATLKTGSTEKPSSDQQTQHRADGKDTSAKDIPIEGSRDCNELFCTGTKPSAIIFGLVLVILVLLVVITILIVFGFRMLRAMNRRLSRPAPRLAGAEEGQCETAADQKPLLPRWQKESNGTVMNGSARAATSHPLTLTGAGPHMQQDGSIAGIAPITTGEHPPRRDQHENLHQLVTNQA